MNELLTEDQIAEHLTKLEGWGREGHEIVRLFSFPSYLAGIRFVDEVAVLAEEANHHPDIQIGWRKVTLKLSTHSKGGLTIADMNLAAKINNLVNAGGVSSV